MTPDAPPYLYHGTSTRRLRSILRHGLVPRGDKKSQWEVHPSRRDHIYLTVAYATFFAVNATDPAIKDRAAVLRIDTDKLDPKNLYADEDALEAANREHDRKRWPDIATRTAWYRDTWELEPAAKLWQGSLALMGNCSHHGAIPADAISGVAIIERNSPLIHMSDPLVSPVNYNILGDFYRAHTAFPWEGPAACVDGDQSVSNIYLANLRRLPVGTDYKAYERPLPVHQIIVAAERERRKAA